MGVNPLQDLSTGLAVGLVYGMVGVGFVVIHRITGMINFAQGDLAVAGSFGAVVAAQAVPPEVSVLAGGAVGAVLGLLLYWLAVHPLRNHGLLVQTIVTLGAALVIRSAIQLMFGTKPYALEPFTAGEPLRFAGLSLQRQTVWLAVVALVLYIALTYFFERTMTGRAMSACAVNRYAAGVVGINATRMAAMAFAISGAVVGLVAATQAPVAFVTSGVGLALALKGFIAAVIGGFQRVGLALVGGLLVGFVEAFTARNISTSYQDVIVLSALLVLLIARPNGLARTKVSERV
jgi:branched-chain amino acid transport system permease protein